MSIEHQQITRSVVGCHKKHPPHQECFTDPSVNEGVCRGAAISCEILPGLIPCGIYSAVDLLAFQALFVAGLEKAADFLVHPFPVVRTSGITNCVEVLTVEQIRAATAEYMYLVMQSKDLGKQTDAAEEVLLETEWWVLA